MGLERDEVVGGRYRVISEIARGGMGVVHRVERIRDGTHFAMKVIRGGLVKGQVTVERFRREAQLLDAIRHPGVVKMVDTGLLAGGEVFLVMELLEGETLYQWFRREAPLSPAELAPALRGVADALDAVHALGAVHRDLKPSNVFVTPDGVKLVDFGIARAANATRLTVTGQIIGTLRYMAPEQVLDREVDARADIYALGVMAWGALVGGPPFGGKGITVLKQVLAGAPSLGVAAPGLSDGIVAAVDRAVALDPSDRFATAGGFADELERHAAGVSADTWRGNPTGYEPIDTTAMLIAHASAPTATSTAFDLPPMSPPTVAAQPVHRASPYARAGITFAAVSLLMLAGTLGWLTMRPPPTSTTGEPTARDDGTHEIELPQPEPPPPAPARRIQLSTHPEGAEVYVGEMVLGNTPLLLPPADDGPYQLELRLAGYETMELRVGPQTSDRISVTMEPRSGPRAPSLNPATPPQQDVLDPWTR